MGVVRCRRTAERQGDGAPTKAVAKAKTRSIRTEWSDFMALAIFLSILIPYSSHAI